MKIELTIEALVLLLETYHKQRIETAVNSNVKAADYAAAFNDNCPSYSNLKPVGTAPDIVHDIIYQIYRGNLIEAIKRYNGYYGRGLKNSKENIEQLKLILNRIFP